MSTTPTGEPQGSPSNSDPQDAEFVRFQPYHFTVHELARLTLLRSRLGDTALERMQEKAA